MLLAEVPDDPRIERVEVIDPLEPQAKDRPDRHGEPERVEERQDAENDLVGVQVHGGVDLMDVAEDVPVGQHDPLRLAGRARGEDEGRRLVERIPAQAGQERPHRGDRHAPRDRRRPDLVGGRHLPGDVLQVEQGPLGGQLELVDRLARGQDVRDPALVDRGVEHLLPGRIVEIDRHLAPERQGDVRHRRRDRRRDEQPDIGRIAERPRQHPAQGERPQERLAVGQGRPRAIGHRGLCATPTRHVNERPRERSPVFRQGGQGEVGRDLRRLGGSRGGFQAHAAALGDPWGTGIDVA